MERKPLVSVIVPVHNNEKHIRKCLWSIMKQTYMNLQVLVVDDGSTDQSFQCIEQFVRMDARFCCIQQENHGAAAARNAAAECADGEYYTFIDADDYVGRDYIQKMIECAVKNQSDLVIAGYREVYLNKKRQKVIIPTIYKQMQQEEWAYRICASLCRMYRSEFWKKYSLQFADVPKAGAEDVPLALYANAMASKICIVPSADYYYVQHPESATHFRENGQAVFNFPYKAVYDMHRKLKECTLTNSRVFYDMGLVKFLAHFEFGIYRHAGKDERKKFLKYVCMLLEDDWDRIVMEWKKYGKGMQFTLLHKLAIGLFIYKYGQKQGGGCPKTRII